MSPITYSGASCSSTASRPLASSRGALARAHGLPVPARDAGKPVRDVLDLDVERRGIEQVEPPPRQHALPGARRCLSSAFARLAHWRFVNLAQAAWRWHVIR